MRSVFAIVVAVTCGAACAAAAEPVNGKAAKGMLFAPARSEVEMLPQDFLPADHVKILKSVGEQQAYYGAIAVSPDEGMMVEATVAAANHHSTEAASKAALAGCEAQRKGRTPCAIVGLIRPRGWSAQALMLSSDATAGFRKNYGGRGSRALAISPSTGLWGIGQGEGAATEAVSACSSMAGGASDCAIAVAD